MQPEPPLTAETISAPWTRRDLWACVLCACLALGLALAPHFTALAHDGFPEFLADTDDVLYLALARPAYYGAPVLRDAYLRPSEGVIDLHAWTQFVPLSELSRLLHVPLIQEAILWRVLGAILMATALFVLFRRLLAQSTRPTAWALGCTVICLCDAGFCQGRSLLENFVDLAPHMWRGTTPLLKPDAVAHYRVVAPLLNLPFLIFMVAALVPGKRRPWMGAVLGGIALGICVLLYFYLWTAAVLSLAGYAAVLLWVGWRRPKQRSSAFDRVKRVAIVLALGLSLGAPQIITNFEETRDARIKPYFERLGRPTHLPAGDPARTRYVVNFWVWMKLAVGALGILTLGLAGLGLLWWLTLAGYLLSNLGAVLGIDYQNFHWGLVHAPMGEILVLVTLVGLLERWRWTGKVRLKSLAWAFPVALLAIAAVWRPYEVLHAPLAKDMSQSLRELRPLRAALAPLEEERVLAGPWQTQVAMLYSRCALLFADPLTTISLIPLEEVNQRHALNAWLQGLDEAGYRHAPNLAVVNEYGYIWPETREETLVRNRLAIFKRFLEDPRAGELLTEHFGVTDLLLPASSAPPVRAGPWSLTEKTGSWWLWKRTVSKYAGSRPGSRLRQPGPGQG